MELATKSSAVRGRGKLRSSVGVVSPKRTAMSRQSRASMKSWPLWFSTWVTLWCDAVRVFALRGQIITHPHSLRCTLVSQIIHSPSGNPNSWRFCRSAWQFPVTGSKEENSVDGPETKRYKVFGVKFQVERLPVITVGWLDVMESDRVRSFFTVKERWYTNFVDQEIPRLDGKVVAITGTTSGTVVTLIPSTYLLIISFLTTPNLLLGILDSCCCCEERSQIMFIVE